MRPLGRKADLEREREDVEAATREAAETFPGMSVEDVAAQRCSRCGMRLTKAGPGEPVCRCAAEPNGTVHEKAGTVTVGAEAAGESDQPAPEPDDVPAEFRPAANGDGAEAETETVAEQFWTEGG